MTGPAKKRTWISILIAAIIIVGVMVIALVGTSAYFISRHIHAQITSTADADAQFDGARRRFAGQTPLIEMGTGDDPIVHRRPEGAHGAPIDVVRAMVYSPDSRKLVNVSVPLWVLRMMPGHRFSFIDSNIDFDSRRTKLTLDDIEQHGPGLILDDHDRHGARILVWAE
jgi:hypothetical protein